MSEETKSWVAIWERRVRRALDHLCLPPPPAHRPDWRTRRPLQVWPVGLSFELAVNQRQNGKKYEHGIFVPEQTTWADFLSFSTLFHYDRPVFPRSLNSLIIFLFVTILQIVRHISFDTIHNILSQYGSLQISYRLKIFVSFHWQPWSGKFRAFWNFWRLDSKLCWQVTRSNLPRRTKCHWVDEYFPSFCCTNLAKMQ